MRFQVIMSQANMPGSCYGRQHYVRIAVVDTDGREARIIREYGPVRRIVRTWERVYFGKTGASAGQRALAAARDLAADLNADHERAEKIGAEFVGYRNENGARVALFERIAA